MKLGVCADLWQDPFPQAAQRLQSELEEKLPELPWAAAEVAWIS